MKRFIGITGSIGSGKSTVSRFWAAWTGLALIDIDLLCRELLEAGKPGWAVLKENLAPSFFGGDGNLDRQALRKSIFADEGLRRQVDRLIHPLALELFFERTAGMEGTVLVDVPLLFEAGWQEHFACTVVVYADPQTCCRRILGRDRVAAEEAARSIRAQMPIGDKAMLADHVVDNRYCWLYARSQVVRLAGLGSGF